MGHRPPIRFEEEMQAAGRTLDREPGIGPDRDYRVVARRYPVPERRTLDPPRKLERPRLREHDELRVDIGDKNGVLDAERFQLVLPEAPTGELARRMPLMDERRGTFTVNGIDMLFRALADELQILLPDELVQPFLCALVRPAGKRREVVNRRKAQRIHVPQEQQIAIDELESFCRRHRSECYFFLGCRKSAGGSSENSTAGAGS